MIKVGIIGGAGYTAGELIRLLLNHPEAEIVFINSSSNAGNKITDVHEGLYGETDLVEEAFIERKDMAYSYNDGDLYYFMDQETFDMVPLGADLLGDAFKFVTENTVCKVLSYKGSVFGLECPNFMDLEITETEPGIAGNTATNTLKPATVETGAEVRVPLFINIGDKITIDTRTGEYLSRAK